jgi:hypothetical protein
MLMNQVLPRISLFIALCTCVSIENARAQTQVTGSTSILASDPRLIEAQIRNQEAQADYYQRITKPAHVLTTSSLGLIGSLLGALVAFLTLHLQAKSQAQLEQAKWARSRGDEEVKRVEAREDDARKEIRLAAADLSKKIAVAAHSMTWVLWIARHDSDNFSRKLLDEHDLRMNNLYAEIVAAQVVVAALDERIYRRTQPLISQIYELDGVIAKLATRLPDSLASLGVLWERSRKFEEDLPGAFLGMLGVEE